MEATNKEAAEECLSKAQAALGREVLRRLLDWLKIRRYVVMRYWWK